MIIIIYTASIRTKTNTYQSQQSHNRVQPQGDIHGEEKQVTKKTSSVCMQKSSKLQCCTSSTECLHIGVVTVHALVRALHRNHKIAHTKNLQAACTLYSHNDIIIIT